MRKRLILVVDDEPDINDLVRAILEQEGYEVISLFDGKETLGYLREGRMPDLIILDYRLSDMKADELCIRMKSIIRDKAIRILLFTATAELGDKLRDSCDAVDILEKPFDTSVLLSMVKKAVG